MKKTLMIAAAILVFCKVQAQVPTATYWWNFNQTNINSTNYIFPTIAGGIVKDPAAMSDGVLSEWDGSGNSVNELGIAGSGVSSGTFPNIPYDRALLIPGVYGNNSYMVRTAGDAYALTNWPNGGILTKFTITCWAKSEGVQGAFPRIVGFGANGQDPGSAGLNCFGLLFYNGGDIQMKIHNASNPNSGNGMSTSTQPLAASATNWVFMAVTYDSTLPTGGAPATGTNVVFYFGDRVNSLTNQPLSGGDSIIYTNYYVTTAESGLGGSSSDGPGIVDFSATGVPLPYCSIGNRYNGTSPTASGGNRGYDGRYDDIRLFANQVLTLAQVEAVRTNAPPSVNGPLTAVTQPANTTVAQGQGASFSFVTSVAANETYQWYKIPQGIGSVSNAIAGATQSYLNTAPLTVAANNGDKYMVIAHSTDPLSDNGGAGLKSQYATATVLPVSAYVPTPGVLKFEYFANAPGQSVSSFLASPTTSYLNNAPDLTLFMPSFDTRTVFPDDSHFNYFVRITGSIKPTVTTNYVFFLRGSDQSQLLLSTDGGVTTNLIAFDTASGPQLFNGVETAGATQGNQFSTSISLVAGTSYPVVAYLKSSSGQNFLQVAWRMDDNLSPGGADLPNSDQDLADRLNPIPASVLSTMALPINTVGISQQPTASPSSTVVANSQITFSLGVTSTGSGPVVVQWRKNGVNISGATGTSYTTPYLALADSGASFDAVVSAPGTSTGTTPVTVTVNSDTVAPKVVSATPDDSMTAVKVQFSEPVDAATALNPANYQINGGAVAVTGVQWSVTTNLVDAPTYDAVTLSTALQADNTAYKVTVTGVKDTVGNTISSGNTAKYTSYGYASGFGKFEYFEDLTYNSFYAPLDTLDVSGMVNYLAKFLNNDPDTIVYPKTLAMAPQGQPNFRTGSTPILNVPAGLFGTRMKTIITPTTTGNYVFYLAADDTALLWLSTDANPANKHLIAAELAASGPQTWSSASSAEPTNTLWSSVTLTNGTTWPIVDGTLTPIITLTAGQRYYLEVDHRESAGFGSSVSVNWDGGTGTPPADGTLSALVGNLIGWHFPMPAINSIAKVGNNVAITFTNGLGPINLGVFPWPGVVAPETGPSIVPSFPTASLQSTPSLTTPVWTTLTNTSPATIPATNSAQFFKVGSQ